jgi:hypothetical protein
MRAKGLSGQIETTLDFLDRKNLCDRYIFNLQYICLHNVFNFINWAKTSFHLSNGWRAISSTKHNSFVQSLVAKIPPIFWHFLVQPSEDPSQSADICPAYSLGNCQHLKYVNKIHYNSIKRVKFKDIQMQILHPRTLGNIFYYNTLISPIFIYVLPHSLGS